MIFKKEKKLMIFFECILEELISEEFING